MPRPLTRPSALLALSLAANAVLLVALLRRSALLSPAAAPARTSPTADAFSTRARDRQALLAALASGDSAAMRAAGVPLMIIQRLAAARAYARLHDLERSREAASTKGGKYWRNSPLNASARAKPTPEQEAESDQAEREFNEAMRAAFGDDAPFGDSADSRYAFLPATTRARILRIEQDYDELRAQLGRESGAVQLPSDTARFKLLDDEQKRDVQAAMSVDERAQFELHATATADVVRSRWGDAIQTEDDYQKVFALQKAFSAQFPADPNADGPPSADAVRAHEAAARQLEDDVRAVVGAENYAALQRANDQDYHMLDAIVTRLALPPETVDAALAIRGTYATQSMQINADASLTPQQRSDQITALAALAQSDLAAKLGSEGATAFVKSSAAPWIGLLKAGTAFSTDRHDAPETSYNGDGTRPIYAVPPKP